MLSWLLGLRVKAAKAGSVVFDKIVINYIACNDSDYAKYEDNSNVGIANINEKCDELFNCEVKANEIILNFFSRMGKICKEEIRRLKKFMEDE